MILSKTSNNNWAPTAGGTGTFIGTLAAFNAIKDTLPVNTVAYITDDGNGDLQPVDAVTNGDMHPVTSNAVYDAMNTKQDVIKTITVHANTWRDYTTVENRYTDWVQVSITSPTIPSGYIALRYFAEVSEVQNGHVDCYPTCTGFDGIPNGVGINTDGQVTTCKLRLGAICIKL